VQRCAICRRSLILSGFATTLGYVEAGLGPAITDYRALYLLNELGLTGTENPATLSGGEARRAALARVLAPEPVSCFSTSRPTTSICPRSNAGKGDRIASLCPRADQSMTAAFWKPVARHKSGSTAARLGGPIAASRFSKNGAIRCWRKKNGTARNSIARSCRRALGALRRHRAAQAQCSAHGQPGYPAPGSARRQARHRHGQDDGERGARKAASLIVEAVGVNKSFGGPADSSRIFSIRIARGDRIGIVGPNGAGKTRCSIS